MGLTVLVYIINVTAANSLYDHYDHEHSAETRYRGGTGGGAVIRNLVRFTNILLYLGPFLTVRIFP